MPTWFRSFARRIPLLGWIAGLACFALFAAYYYAKKARILAGQLRAERDIVKISRAHEKYVRTQLEGHARTSADVSRQWHKLQSRAQSRRDELRRKAANSAGLAEAWNDAFSK